MRINKFGQITNKDVDLLLTPTQESFMKSLLDDDGKATSLSLRYGKAIANKVTIPSTICDMSFKSIEEAFAYLATLEYESCDDHDVCIMQALQYYFP